MTKITIYRPNGEPSLEYSNISGVKLDCGVISFQSTIPSEVSTRERTSTNLPFLLVEAVEM
jgi:hypothetical protein